MLLEAGADKYAQDVRGKSPLDHAVIQENLPMVELLEGWNSADTKES
jgi:ankyrin repeat protein